MTTITKTLLSATLKAEAVRIRHLRNTRRAALRRGRAELTELRAAGNTPGGWTDHHHTAARLRWACVCPSQRARCANLALGHLRGHAYKTVEGSTKTPDDVLFGALAKEIATKAGVPHGEIVSWLRE
jgi:hypothetical protein